MQPNLHLSKIQITNRVNNHELSFNNPQQTKTQITNKSHEKNFVQSVSKWMENKYNTSYVCR